ncbi:MAG: nucleotidyl transferase AbiEii/AbiGii toxin family protein [Actinobacteria bacterium]|nr:nucleotidyl transferase AbiEii/AbiGii toxin family protein [Actinomycetota bacterium]
MINKELEKIINEEKAKGYSGSYIRNKLKELLQVYVLNYIYTDLRYNKNLIFTGGTCLKIFYDLPRLSEDLDFDYLNDVNTTQLINDIEAYFKKQFQYKRIIMSLKQRDSQIILKFPILHKLGLARVNESDLLYVKLDFSRNPSKFYDLIITSKSIYGFNFVAKHYDLSSLMSGKLHAILSREKLTGTSNRETVKGRDYFDLLWFLKKSIKPNIKRLSEMLGKEIDMASLQNQLDLKVKEVILKYKSDFKSNLLPLIINPAFLNEYISNYYDEYMRYKNQVFGNE